MDEIEPGSQYVARDGRRVHTVRRVLRGVVTLWTEAWCGDERSATIVGFKWKNAREATWADLKCGECRKCAERKEANR